MVCVMCCALRSQVSQESGLHNSFGWGIAESDENHESFEDYDNYEQDY